MITTVAPSDGAELRSDARRTLADVEWPTVAVAATIYALFGLLTWFHALIPVWLTVAVGAYLVAWHGSLQHEVVHGHPTPWRRVNEALVFPSLWLWLPFPAYRDSHIRHHSAAVLADPACDPESFYVAADAWPRLSAPSRWLLMVNATLLGRLTLGPALIVGRFAVSELRALPWSREHCRAWLAHAGGVGLTLAWVCGVCAMPLWEYLVVIVYPGTALSLLRSYGEHQAHADAAGRTTVVEAEVPLALVFLNNNLHTVHHAWPGMPWYRLPAAYRDERRRTAADSAPAYRGYRAIVARYLVRTRRSPIYPVDARQLSD